MKRPSSCPLPNPMLFHAGCVPLSISGRAALAAVAHRRSLTCPSSLSSSGPCRTRYQVPHGATSARCLSMASRLPSPAPVPRAPPRQHPPPRRSTTHPQPCLLRSQAPHQTHRRSDGQFRLPPSTASPYVLARTTSRARAWPSRLSRPQRYLGAQLCPAMRSPKENASTRPPPWPMTEQGAQGANRQVQCQALRRVRRQQPDQPFGHLPLEQLRLHCMLEWIQ